MTPHHLADDYLLVIPTTHHHSHPGQTLTPILVARYHTSTMPTPHHHHRPTVLESDREPEPELDWEPGPMKVEVDFPTLHHLSSTSQILFRLTDPTSISPLYWTGNPQTSGFGSPNLNLALLDRQSYSKVFNHHLTPSHSAGAKGGRGWEEEPYIRHTVLDHILGKEKQTCLITLTSMDERPGTPEDERSPWISTSTNLVWVVYDLVRRLVLLERGTVYLTVIAHPNLNPPTSAVSSNRARQERGGKDGEVRSGDEIIISPTPLLRLSHQKAKEMMLSVGLKENYDTARKASENSGEVLVWGRIFSESVICHLEFTLEVRRFIHRILVFPPLPDHPSPSLSPCLCRLRLWFPPLSRLLDRSSYPSLFDYRVTVGDTVLME